MYLSDPSAQHKVKNATDETIQEVLLLYSQQFNQRATLEQVIPRKINNDVQLATITTDLVYPNNDIAAINQCLLETTYDYIDRGGKRIRPVLSIILAECLGENMKHDLNMTGVDLGERIGAIGEMIHNGSLIIDDIEDSSDFRRGKECLHVIYGQDVAINVGCYMYFQPLASLLDIFDHPHLLQLQSEVMRHYQQEMVNIHFGQGLDITWHNRKEKDLLEGQIPTEDQYLQMTNFKTGVLPRLMAKLVCSALGVDKVVAQKVAKYCEGLGIAFQIQDDLLCLDSTGQYSQGKGYVGEDIHEGKLTLIVIHCLNNSILIDKKRLIHLLTLKTKDQVLIQEAIQLMIKTNSIQYAQQRAKEIITSSWDQVHPYLPNNYAKQLLKLIGNYSIYRKI